MTIASPAADGVCERRCDGVQLAWISAPVLTGTSHFRVSPASLPSLLLVSSGSSEQI